MSDIKNIEIAMKNAKSAISDFAQSRGGVSASVTSSSIPVNGASLEVMELEKGSLFGETIDDSKCDITDWINKEIIPTINDLNEKCTGILKRTGATIGTFATSLSEGIGQLGESLVDLIAMLGGAVVTPFVWIGDKISGSDRNYTSEFWDNIKSFVAEKYVTNFYDDFYNNDAVGKLLKENSYGFDITRGIGSGVGYIAGVVALTVATFGVGGVASGGGVTASTVTAATSTSNMAITAGVAGVGKGTQDAWADGADIIEGLGYGAFSGLWEGIQFGIGGKIGASNIFKFGSEGATKAANALARIILDGVDGGAEGIIQPLLGLIYKDGYYDDEGNYIEFENNDSITYKYTEIFDDFGGINNIATNAFVGGIASTAGELFGLGKYFNKNKDLNIETIKFNSRKDAAIYFNDSKQYMFQSLDDLLVKYSQDSTALSEIYYWYQKFQDKRVCELDEDAVYASLYKYFDDEEKRIIDRLRVNSLKDNLTGEELDLINSYTYVSGPAICAYLRQAATDFYGTNINGIDIDYVKKYILKSFECRNLTNLNDYINPDNFVRAMDNIINKSVPLSDNIVVYRGVSGLFVDGNKIDLAKLDIGQRINDKAFLSASTSLTGIATDNKIMLEIEVPKGTKGAYIEKFTADGKYCQQEILFNRNSVLEITDLPQIEIVNLNGQSKQVLKIKAKYVDDGFTSAKRYMPDVNNMYEVSSYNDLYNKLGIGKNIKDILKKMEDNGSMKRFNEEVSDMYNRKLYDGWKSILEHDYDHVKNVLLYSMYMGEELKLNPKEMDILIESAKYHDTGVTNQNMKYRGHEGHSFYSSEKIASDLKGKYNSKDIAKMQAIIEFHEQVDESLASIQSICEKYGLKDKKSIAEVEKIGKILKDADALDRTRFPGNLNLNYLRNKEVANDLIKASYEMREAISAKELDEIVQDSSFDDNIKNEIFKLINADESNHLVNFARKYYKNYNFNSMSDFLAAMKREVGK